MKSYKVLFTLIVGIGLLTSSCVSKKSFDALQSEKDELAMQLEKLQADFDATKANQDSEISSLKDANMSLSSQKSSLDADLAQTKKDMNSKISAVQADVDDKQTQLDALRAEINSAFADVDAAVAGSNARISEMENFLYLDLENDVDFSSGSTRVSADDTETLETLANMLKNNPKVALIIEGHTDSKKVLDGKAYKDNWDLSVARATEVIRKLVSMGVNADQLIASGRAENMPVADNDSADGRAQNRRTEAILVPNVGKLYKLKG
jgi:chemotaxis protein MotB